MYKFYKNTLTAMILIVGIIITTILLAIISLKYGPPYTPAPIITEGEFPFKIEYEIAGVRKTIEDTWIYKYAGTTRDFEEGETRDWNIDLKSGRKEIIIYDKNNVMLYFMPEGTPDYYMGTLELYGEHIESVPEEHIEPFPHIRMLIYEGETNKYIGKSEEKREKELLGKNKLLWLTSDELFRKYKFKWISGEYSDPIVNDFNKNK